jgi:hypothetical protein
MAAMAFNRAAVQAAQRAALAKQRAEELAAAQARRIAAQEAAAARRAAAQAAAEEAKAAKRAAKLTAMPPRRAWKKMTPQERLLKIAETELGFYGEIVSPEAKAAYGARAAKGAATRPPTSAESGPPGAATPPKAHTAAGVPAYLRALDLSLSPRERALAKEEAASDPEQWQKYVAALRAQKAYYETPGHEPGMSGGDSLPSRGLPATKPAAPQQPPSEYVPPPSPVSPQTRRAAAHLGHNAPMPRLAAAAPASLSGTAGGRAADTPAHGHVSQSKLAVAGFGGDGLFVVGLDITAGVYRTPGPAGGNGGFFSLLKSTSTRDVMEHSSVKGPATITVGRGVKAVQVRGCRPWSRLGDTLDEVIAAASKPDSTAGIGGDGLFVVGLDITAGVYRTPGPAGGNGGFFSLLKSTSTRDVMEFSSVKGPATITVGRGVKAVQVRGCRPWSRLGDTLDEVIARGSQVLLHR